MFTGDFLFKECIGRMDLEYASYLEMMKSIEKIKKYIVNSCREIHRDLANSIISDIGTNKQITWQELAIIIDNNIHKFE